MIVGAAGLVALSIALYSFVFMLVRWKTAKRRCHVIRLIMAIIAVPCLVGIQYYVNFSVWLPALGRQQLAEFNAAKSERLAKTSIKQVGDSAPHFSLMTADGDAFSLADDGKVTLINFFATWCGPCQLELPHIERIWEANKNDEHFRLVVIGRGETTDSVREHRGKNGFSFPIAADPDRSVYSLFAKELIPRTIIVSPEGRIVYSKAGFYEDNLNELNAVLQEEFARLK